MKMKLSGVQKVQQFFSHRSPNTMTIEVSWDRIMWLLVAIPPSLMPFEDDSDRDVAEMAREACNTILMRCGPTSTTVPLGTLWVALTLWRYNRDDGAEWFGFKR